MGWQLDGGFQQGEHSLMPTRGQGTALPQSVGPTHPNNPPPYQPICPSRQNPRLPTLKGSTSASNQRSQVFPLPPSSQELTLNFLTTPSTFPKLPSAYLQLLNPHLPKSQTPTSPQLPPDSFQVAPDALPPPLAPKGLPKLGEGKNADGRVSRQQRRK